MCEGTQWAGTLTPSIATPPAVGATAGGMARWVPGLLKDAGGWTPCLLQSEGHGRKQEDGKDVSSPLL